jgi:hypothetical protein
MGEILGDRIPHQVAKHLQTGKKGKKSHQFWNSIIEVLVFLMLLLLHPVLSVYLSVSLRQVWSPPVMA